jgi:hypothetical protein
MFQFLEGLIGVLPLGVEEGGHGILPPFVYLLFRHAGSRGIQAAN